MDVMPFVYIGDTITNIFTAFGRYIHDYGILGMSLIVFLIGFWYEKLFNKLISSQINGRNLVLYAFISYPLVEMSIEERVMSNLLTARTIYIVIYLYIIFRYIVKKQVE